MSWLTPNIQTNDNFTDPEKAWDGNEDTYAISANQTFSLALQNTNITSCNRIRLKCNNQGSGGVAVDIGAWYNGTWNLVYDGSVEGDLLDGQWNELVFADIPAGVNNFRFSLGSAADVLYLYEVNFWKEDESSKRKYRNRVLIISDL